MSPVEDGELSFEESRLLEDLPGPDLFRGLYHLLFAREPADSETLGHEIEAGAIRPGQAVEWLINSSEWTHVRPMSELGPSLHVGRAAFIRMLPKAKRILDLGGVALGDPRGGLVSMGYPYPFDEIVIVDLPSDDRHALYQENGRYDVVDTDRGPVRYQYHSMADLSRYPSGSFDLVYSGQSIEHVSQGDAEHVMRQVRRVLKPGGWFALDTPNARLTRLQQVTFVDPDHKYEYEHRELVAMLEGTGFRVVQAVGINYGGASVQRGVFDPSEIATNRGLFADVADCYLLGYLSRPISRGDVVGMARLAKWQIDGPRSQWRQMVARMKLSKAARRLARLRRALAQSAPKNGAPKAKTPPSLPVNQ